MFADEAVFDQSVTELQLPVLSLDGQGGVQFPLADMAPLNQQVANTNVRALLLEHLAELLVVQQAQLPADFNQGAVRNQLGLDPLYLGPLFLSDDSLGDQQAGNRIAVFRLGGS